jgi:hypothetical protein
MIHTIHEGKNLDEDDGLEGCLMRRNRRYPKGSIGKLQRYYP